MFLRHSLSLPLLPPLSTPCPLVWLPVFPLRFPKPSGIWPQKSGPRDLSILSDYRLRLFSRLPTLKSAGFLICMEVTCVTHSLVIASESPAIFMEDIMNHCKCWAWVPTLAHKSSVFPGQYILAFYGDFVEQLRGVKAEDWHPASSGRPRYIFQSFPDRTPSICSAGV